MSTEDNNFPHKPILHPLEQKIIEKLQHEGMKVQYITIYDEFHSDTGVLQEKYDPSQIYRLTIEIPSSILSDSSFDEEKILEKISLFSSPLQHLTLINFSLLELNYLPNNLSSLTIVNSDVNSFFNWSAPQILDLTEIQFENCSNLKSFIGFPSPCSSLKHVFIENCPFHTFEHFPKTPNIEKIILKKTVLKNFFSYPKCFGTLDNKNKNLYSGYYFKETFPISLYGFNFEDDLAATLIHNGKAVPSYKNREIQIQVGDNKKDGYPVYRTVEFPRFKLLPNLFVFDEYLDEYRDTKDGFFKGDYYIKKDNDFYEIVGFDKYIRTEEGKFICSLPSPYLLLMEGIQPETASWLKDFHPNYKIPDSFIPKLDITRFTPKEIYNHFETSPTTLAERYARKEKLSDFEKDRIIHEGTFTTLKVLYQRVGSQDNLLNFLAKRWDINLHQDQKFLL